MAAAPVAFFVLGIPPVAFFVLCIRGSRGGERECIEEDIRFFFFRLVTTKSVRRRRN